MTPCRGNDSTGQPPKPANFSGGSEPLTVGGSFTLQRVLGTVPVEGDGSAYFDVPALRSLLFVALDKDEMSVKRMQSFVTVQPGEALPLRVSNPSIGGTAGVSPESGVFR